MIIMFCDERAQLEEEQEMVPLFSSRRSIASGQFWEGGIDLATLRLMSPRALDLDVLLVAHKEAAPMAANKFKACLFCFFCDRLSIRTLAVLPDPQNLCAGQPPIAKKINYYRSFL